MAQHCIVPPLISNSPGQVGGVLRVTTPDLERYLVGYVNRKTDSFLQVDSHAPAHVTRQVSQTELTLRSTQPSSPCSLIRVTLAHL